MILWLLLLIIHDDVIDISWRHLTSPCNNQHITMTKMGRAFAQRFSFILACCCWCCRRLSMPINIRLCHFVRFSVPSIGRCSVDAAHRMTDCSAQQTNRHHHHRHLIAILRRCPLPQKKKKHIHDSIHVGKMCWTNHNQQAYPMIGSQEIEDLSGKKPEFWVSSKGQPPFICFNPSPFWLSCPQKARMSF